MKRTPISDRVGLGFAALLVLGGLAQLAALAIVDDPFAPAVVDVTPAPRASVASSTSDTVVISPDVAWEPVVFEPAVFEWIGIEGVTAADVAPVESRSMKHQIRLYLEGGWDILECPHGCEACWKEPHRCVHGWLPIECPYHCPTPVRPR